MLDAEDLSSLVPVPPTDGGRKRRAAPRKSTLRRVPLTAPEAISADDAFGHLSSLTSGMSPRTVDGLIKAVRKEAADYVVARQAERSAEVKREREAAAKARRGSVIPRRASVTPPLAGAGAAAAAAGAAAARRCGARWVVTLPCATTPLPCTCWGAALTTADAISLVWMSCCAPHSP